MSATLTWIYIKEMPQLKGGSLNPPVVALRTSWFDLCNCGLKKICEDVWHVNKQTADLAMVCSLVHSCLVCVCLSFLGSVVGGMYCGGRGLPAHIPSGDVEFQVVGAFDRKEKQ